MIMAPLVNEGRQVVEALEAVRNKLGLPLYIYARILGVTRMTYYNWVQGRTQMTPNNVEVMKAKGRAIIAAVNARKWPAYDKDESKWSTIAKFRKVLYAHFSYN